MLVLLLMLALTGFNGMTSGAEVEQKKAEAGE
jgi:hypothetical protein